MFHSLPASAASLPFPNQLGGYCTICDSHRQREQAHKSDDVGMGKSRVVIHNTPFRCMKKSKEQSHSSQSAFMFFAPAPSFFPIVMICTSYACHLPFYCAISERTSPLLHICQLCGGLAAAPPRSSLM